MSDSTPPPLGESTPLVPPLYQSSVYTLPDLDALDRIVEGVEPGFIYARDGHPNARFLADQLARGREKRESFKRMSDELLKLPDLSE